ncbi:ParB N-terminal domain-containing protein [Treponema pedis]|uniref:ParB-like nuclease n=2 Tax=Treponema pedis TaxID=409322 RepID=S5ZYL7_9SPIR|nr:ParB N-terminal domain-containing protein [Treponema pedis]AGT43163.1 ParB-like nuclease [Treponema pedis str. T A4]
MQVEIEGIKIKKRARKELLEIPELAESIKRLGLLTPITIDEHNVLIAGQRRLEAAKLLGWKTITANVVSAEDEAAALEMEIEENIQRHQFTDEELFNAFTRLNRIRQPNIFIRIWNAIKNFFTRLFGKKE